MQQTPSADSSSSVPPNGGILSGRFVPWQNQSSHVVKIATIASSFIFFVTNSYNLSTPQVKSRNCSECQKDQHLKPEYSRVQIRINQQDRLVIGLLTLA